MYKWLLCWRYLRTRYLALACVISVMLGVATLIVVNGIMGGFSAKLREKLHGLLSDVAIESHDYQGFAGYEEMMAVIRHDPFLGKHVEAMSPTLEIFAMLQHSVNGRPFARAVRLIGVRPEERAKVGGFAEHLARGKNHPSFELSEEGKRRVWMNTRRPDPVRLPLPEETPLPKLPGVDLDGPVAPPVPIPAPEAPTSEEFQPEGVIVGHAIAYWRLPKPDEDGNVEACVLPPGEEVVLTTISGARMSPVFARFAVADTFKSEMSEYDSNYVFVSLEQLQKLRAMEGRVTSIQVKVRDESARKDVVERLKALLGPGLKVETWEDKQGPLLAAISVEKGILNILLFLIIGVAGFGILAIFSMIVVEKTRDIGILKALGASNGGVMQIFLGYGLLLGVVGAALGTGAGLWITSNINGIESWLSWATGLEVFPRNIYYFDSIPTDVQAWHVALINLGSVAIAVLFSVLPALRAAWLHPVKALRFE
jgi:lipoprotein-releasing system permease protein